MVVIPSKKELHLNYILSLLVSKFQKLKSKADFPRWGKSLSFEGTYQYPGLKTFVTLKKWRNC
jgi:hypothetical protein